MLLEGRKCIIVRKVGSEADAGSVPDRVWVGHVKLRMEGRRNRVGATALT